jgi:hypothetical protein
VFGFAIGSGGVPVDEVRKLVVSTARQRGGEFSTKSGKRVEETEAFRVMFGRSLGG